MAQSTCQIVQEVIADKDQRTAQQQARIRQLEVRSTGQLFSRSAAPLNAALLTIF